MLKEFKPEQIIDIVCNALNVDDITAPSRKPVLAHARIIAAVLMRRHTKLTYEQIGTYLSRDKTSIYSFENRFNQLLKEEHPIFKERWLTVFWEGMSC
jgi:chromosomal replication initiation ATPase DnaA